MDEQAITLRPVAASDRDFVADVHRSAYHDLVTAIWGGWDERTQAGYVDEIVQHPTFEIVEQAGVPIGFISITHEPDHDYLEMIALAPSARGRGVGSRLIRDRISAATARCMPLRLTVLDGNRAQDLYRRLGFVVTSAEPPRTEMEWRA
jgi:ribosomal protein S18 acetylase RimI-like enzyme